MPFVTLVVREAILFDDSSMFIDGVLFLDVHWGKKSAGDSPCLVEQQGGGSSHNRHPLRQVSVGVWAEGTCPCGFQRQGLR